MSITIIIPGYERLDFLNTVFDGIKRQTVLNKVTKIIYSEGGDDFTSKEYCKNYAGLDITYVVPPTRMGFVEHWAWLMNQVETEYTAMLHNDDWWYPTHLEYAWDSLQKTDVVAYFSNFVFAKDEFMKGSNFHYPSLMSLNKEIDASSHIQYFNFKEISRLCYLYTPFHTSAMVVRTAALKTVSMNALITGQPWYADRILYPHLCLQGKIAFSPQVLCAIRYHKFQHTNDIDQKKKSETHKEGSMKILQLASENSIDVIREWEMVREKVNEQEWSEVQQAFAYYFGEDNIFKEKDTITNRGSLPKKILKNLLPYGLVSYYAQTGK